MKKQNLRRIVRLIAMAAAMILGLTAGLAETAPEAASMTVDEAALFYEEYLGRITDPEEEINYLVGGLEYGLLEPGDVNPEMFLNMLKKVNLVEADITEAPDGEFLVLRFPDHCQFDFFLNEAEKNYMRLTVFGDQDESILLKAVLAEEDAYMTISDIIDMWIYELAQAHGLAQAPEEVTSFVPETGWLRDSVDGATWQDDRASLEIIPEGDGFKVLIVWGSSAWEATEWTYACYYDQESDRLTAVHVICDDVVYDDNMNENRTNRLDTDCETVFALNEEGKLVITGAADEQLEGKTFEKITLQ